MEKCLIWDFGEHFGREPVLRRMKNGELVVTFLTGGPTEPHNENVVQISRSADDGHTWSAPETIFKHTCRGVWCTELFAECERPFAVVMTYNAQCHYRELQTFLSYTDDGGRTWSEPASIPGGLNSVTLRQGIVLSNGDWLFPMYWQETTGDFDFAFTDRCLSEKWPFRSGVAITSDCGKTWNRFGYLANQKGLWEPNCVEAEDGHIIMLMRNNDCNRLARSDSYDCGRTWTAPSVTDIPNPNTKLTLLRLNGKILLINNFQGDSYERTHLEIRVSDDGLKTFNRVMPLEASGEAWFYPHAYVDENEQILYVAYENAHVHRLAKIPFSELFNNAAEFDNGSAL